MVLDLNGQQRAFQPFTAHEEPGRHIWQSLAKLNFDTSCFPVVTLSDPEFSVTDAAESLLVYWDELIISRHK